MLAGEAIHDCHLQHVAPERVANRWPEHELCGLPASETDSVIERRERMDRSRLARPDMATSNRSSGKGSRRLHFVKLFIKLS